MNGALPPRSLLPSTARSRRRLGEQSALALRLARAAVDRAFHVLAPGNAGRFANRRACRIHRSQVEPKHSRASRPATDHLLAIRRFADENEAGQVLKRKIEKRVVHFTVMDELGGFLTGLERAKDRNSWKRLVLIAPEREPACDNHHKADGFPMN